MIGDTMRRRDKGQDVKGRAKRRDPATRGLTKSDCWVIVAAHNEERHIAEVVRRCKAAGFPNVVVANDGSKDKTAQLAQAAGAMVVTHIVNLGKGAVMKTGADYAVAHGAKAVVFIDGDGQHKPEELPKFLARLRQGYGIVFGYRKQTKKMPFLRGLGKIVTRTVVRLFYNLDLQDILSGYRALTAETYRKVRWTSCDYRVESEMIARAGKENIRYSEFEIATIYLDSYKGVTVIDGIKILFYLVTWRMTH